MMHRCAAVLANTRVMWGAGKPARVVGTRICRADVGTRRDMHAGAGRARV